MKIRRRSAVPLAVLVAMVGRTFDARALEGHTGTLTLSVTDARTEQVVPARVRVRDAQGKDHVPLDAVVVRIGKDRWFASDGNVHLDVPAGQTSIRVERGKEYRPVKTTVAVVTRVRIPQPFGPCDEDVIVTCG